MTVGAKNLKPVGCAPTPVPPILRFVVFLANDLVLLGRRRRVSRLRASSGGVDESLSFFLVRISVCCSMGERLCRRFNSNNKVSISSDRLELWSTQTLLHSQLLIV